MKNFGLVLVLSAVLFASVASQRAASSTTRTVTTRYATTGELEDDTSCKNVDISTNFTDPYGNGTCECPDVYLYVPQLEVDKINLTVKNLFARVSLSANVGSLVQISAGVDVRIDEVNLDIQGVRAKLLLEARLGKVEAILSRALDTLDKNPNLLTDLIKAIDGLLSSVVNTLGQTVQTIVDATGNILQKVVSSAGEIISQDIIGQVLDLPVVSNATNTFGQLVLTVRDMTGNLIDVTVNDAGKVVGTKVRNGGI
eukprot:TRINITY_DN1751_c0_g1_i1.p1 TRINITY_DN1751_c0_g1~~TRINITY_DN1751_c0_g1_i1.p1  ORF type:complete len:255 (-),score=70.02 TRINITY_DN1751_c0_g1_i1:99-863(-)